MAAMTKQELRNEMKRRISALSEGVLNDKSRLISSLLEGHPMIRKAEVIAAFAPMKDEPDIFGALKTLSAEHRILLPAVSGEEMEFRPFNPEIDAVGAFGIREPVSGNVTGADEIDVMIVPGRAFTSQGQRCGRGKGFYDRYMARPGFRAYTIGVCFSEQITDSVPAEEFDRPVDCIIKA